MWVDAVTIEQIADTLRQLYFGAQPEKAQQAARTLLRYAALNAEYAGKTKKRVFLQILCLPVVKDTIQHRVLTTCGGKRLLTTACRGRKSAVSRCWQGIPRPLSWPDEILKVNNTETAKIPVIA